MTSEREIRVVLLDGSEIIMNTGDRVLFQASKPGAIPLTIDADSIIDDLILSLEEKDRSIKELQEERGRLCLKYYEFNKTEYYALIAVKPSKVSTMIKAMKIYVDVVAYDSVDELRLNGLHPDEITREQAMLKFLVAPGNYDIQVGLLKNQFNECVDNVLLIDQSLI